MKRTFAVLMILLIVAAVALSQGVQPTGPAATGGVQANKSAMVGGRHDFGPGGFFARFNAKEAAGSAPTGTCDYCHRPHIMGADGAAAPLWARSATNQAGKLYGYYSSISLDDDSANGHLRPINLDNNYSAFCLSCHDGSAFLTTSAYGSNGTPYSSTYPYTASDVVPDSFKFADAGYGPSGSLQLSHTHPVNIDYDYAVANDGEIYPRQTAGYVWLDNGTTPVTAIGRLFPGPNGPTMQCSSCHNVHKITARGIGVVSPSTDNGGALCVTCHMK